MHISMENTLIAGNPSYLDNGNITLASIIPPYLHNKSQSDFLASERERIRAEFFATYDVMTGVRIAATLGGFFGLMVFLIVWKSRSSSNETLRVLKDPKMAAVAAVCMQEEEEREIQEAIVATGMSIYPDEYDAIAYRRQRMLSLGNVSAPPMLNRGFRFASVGADSLSAAIGLGRRKSGSETSRMLYNFPVGTSFGTDDYFMESEDELENCSCVERLQQKDEITKCKHNDAINCKPLLEVPTNIQDSRRSSAMTCCSTESSYLERRCSAFTLGLGSLPQSLQRKLSTTSRASSNCDTYDYYYPEIQLIQPTPKASPCPSERNLYQQVNTQGYTEAKPTTSSTVANNYASTTTTLWKTNKTNTASNMLQPRPSTAAAPTFIPKHSLAVCDPDSAQSGRRLEIHSVSSDAANAFSYNNELQSISSSGGDLWHKLKCTPSTTNMQVSNLVNTPKEGVSYRGGKDTDNFIQSVQFPKKVDVVLAAASAVVVNSSSTSVDSTPASSDHVKRSNSQDTVSAKTLFNTERRAPLASLSSFKISTLEYPDYNIRSFDEDSEFTEHIADTDEDMQQLSSDSDDASLALNPKKSIRISGGPLESMPTQSLGSSYNGNKSNEITVINNPNEAALLIEGHGRQSVLQRQHTLGSMSNDRFVLIGQYTRASQSPVGVAIETEQLGNQETIPLETHFGSIICTNNSPMHPRRAQLMQQYSDPHSLPTTTTTTTTTEDTCSTMNTEVCGDGESNNVFGDCVGTNDNGTEREDDCDGNESTAHTQHSSLNTVVSVNSISTNAIPINYFTEAENHAKSLPQLDMIYRPFRSQERELQNISGSEVVEDPSASSFADVEGKNASRPTLICLPPSLRKLIVQGSGAVSNTDNEKAISAQSGLNYLPFPIGNSAISSDIVSSASSQVLLELPLIRLPTNDSSESSSTVSDCEDEADRNQGRRNSSQHDNDPSLPNSSRQWSKETLF